jgi:hypothetical protein
MIVTVDCSVIFLVSISLIQHGNADAAPKSPYQPSSSSSSSFLSPLKPTPNAGASFSANGFFGGLISLPSSGSPSAGDRFRNKRFKSRPSSGDRRIGRLQQQQQQRQQQQQEEGDKITREINKLANDLKERKILLSEARDKHRQLSRKLKTMIKKTRRKRLYFFDSLLLKTLKYNQFHLKRIKEQMNRIDSSNDILTSGTSRGKKPKSGSSSSGKRVKLRDFEADHIMREISRQNIVSDSDLIIADSSKRITLLNAVLDDMAREKNLI